MAPRTWKEYCTTLVPWAALPLISVTTVIPTVIPMLVPVVIVMITFMLGSIIAAVVAATSVWVTVGCYDAPAEQRNGSGK
ncbi:MAG: hypothetical protein JO278_15970 [Dyella sp.]|nr:hypothetical protein [Dyella sp.]